MISEAILIPKIYARLQKIASNFSKFTGGGPQNPAGPLSKIPGSAPEFYSKTKHSYTMFTVVAFY